MSVCERCEKLPDLAEGEMAVFFWPPLGHTSGKIKSAAKGSDAVQSIDTVSRGLRVDISSSGPASFFEALDSALTSGEKEDTHCLLYTGDGEPNLNDFGAVTTLKQAISRQSGKWLMDVIAKNRLASLFQPIVYTNKPNTPFAHECLLRWYDDTERMQSPARLFQTAKDADLLFQLDRAARETHMRNAAKASPNSKIFVNFTPTAIYDPRNCLRATFNIIHDVGISPDQVVFEVIETEQVKDPGHLKSILDYYKEHGFGVALDDLGAGHATLQMLGELLPDYVKLDMEMVRDVDRNHFKGEMVRHIISLAHDFSIKVIAEGIESREEAAWLTSQRVDFMQGYYFAKPGAEPLAEIERRT